jgi:hypothetical protein
MTETIRYTLRNLVLQYGFTAVHEDFLDMAKQLQADLDGMFKTSAAPIAVAVEAKKPVDTVDVKPVRVVKTAKEVMKDLVVVPAPVPGPVGPVGPVKAEEVTKLMTHKLMIEKRVEELKAQGITAPFPSLTLENMKTWLETDGMTYWTISEKTGAQDAVVSAMAKMYGLQSNASKMIMFKRQKK